MYKLHRSQHFQQYYHKYELISIQLRPFNSSDSDHLTPVSSLKLPHDQSAQFPRQVAEALLMQHLHVVGLLADDVVCAESRRTCWHCFPSEVQQVVVFVGLHHIVSFEFFPVLHFALRDRNQLDDGVVVWLQVIGTGHKHEHGVPQLHIHQHGGQKDLFGLVTITFDMLVADNQDGGFVRVYENQHGLPLIFLRNHPDLLDYRETGEGGMPQCVFPFFEPLSAVDCIELECSIVFYLLVEQHQLAYRIQLPQNHLLGTELFTRHQAVADWRILPDGGMVADSGFALFADGLHDVEGVAVLEQVEGGLGEDIAFAPIIVHFGLWQFADLIQSFLPQVQQDQVSSFQDRAQDLVAGNGNSRANPAGQLALVEDLLVDERVVVEVEVVAEEDDGAGAEGHDWDEAGALAALEDVVAIGQGEEHRPIIILTRMKNQINNEQSDLQELLEEFNKIDKRKQGNIKLQDATRLLREKTHTHVFSDDLLDRVIFTTDKMVTFDEFLALLYEAELDSNQHNNLMNYRMVEFLHLLDDYRKKCEESSMYAEAEKAHQKTMEIKDKEMRRHKQKLMMQQKSKVMSVNSLQQNKLLDFNTAWNDYMEKYEDAALSSIEKLKAKHLRQMEVEEQRIRNYYENYLKPSKKVIELRSREKQLVKQKQYMEAERLKKFAEKLEEKDREEKNLEINERIKKRKETLQKHQEASLMAHLKRLEKDRNDQIKKRQMDSEKMLIKLRNIQNDIVQKQSVEIKETLVNLRQTMCLTSGQLFNSRNKRIRSTEKLQSLEKSRLKAETAETKPNGGSFKIRVNSFHRAKFENSMYNP